MVVIRLSRSGAKKRPYYRAVVADRRMPRDGRYIEQVGTYDPKIKNSIKFLINRVDYWIKMGAKPSKTVGSLIRRFKMRD
jgi:small subunit ribosomal protein S16